MSRAANREMSIQPTYLTTGQAARRLGVAKNTLLRAVRLGEIRVARQMPGGALRFLPTDVDAYATDLASRHRERAEPASHAGDTTPRSGSAQANDRLTRASAGALDVPIAELPVIEAPPIQAGFERLAQVTAHAESGVDSLVSNVLALVADSLHVGLIFLARADGAVWRLDWVHDRVGMRLAPGSTMPLWETCRETLLAGAGTSLIVDDVQADARFSTVSDEQKRGFGSYTGVPLHHADGRLYGALCTLHPRARTVPDGEITLLRLAGHIVVQAVEAAALRHSERHLMQQVAASEERYRRIVETAQEGIVQVDREGRCALVNQRMADILGYSVAEMQGQPMLTFIAEDEQAMAWARLRRRLQDNHAHLQYDLKCRRKDGSVAWLLISANPLTDASGEVIGALAMATDITDRKQAEEKLKRSEEQYRRIVETAQEGIMVLDPDARLTYVNQFMALMLGYAVEEMRGESLFSFMGEEQATATRVAYEQRRRLLAQRRQFDALLRHKDGTDVWVLASSAALTDETGQFTGELVMLTDITERKQAEAKTRQSKTSVRDNGEEYMP